MKGKALKHASTGGGVKGGESQRGGESVCGSAIIRPASAYALSDSK
jgi:hypothetical protein